MIARSEAEDHLRIIRSLMEKATIYRALSAPAALVGGLLSLGASGYLMWFARHNDHGFSNAFATAWAVVFVLTAGVSLLLIRRDAQRRGQPFLSVGARSALRAMLPPMLFAAALTVTSIIHNAATAAVPWWIGLYGLSLLAMTHFAPRSLSILGGCFLTAGIIAALGIPDSATSRTEIGSDGPCILMAATFGMFHLVYAFCTWPRSSAAAQTHDD
jgi:hypothetical protein